MISTNSVQSYTKPKRKVLKIVLLSILVIILGVGIWFGTTIYNTLKKITSFSSGGSVFSLLKDSNTQLKGESDGRTNILLLGMGGSNHPGGNLSDTIIVLSLDWKDKKVAMISVPRDLWVPIPDYGTAKINEAYAAGEKNQKTTGGGGQVASQTVSNILGIPIHYFVKVDFKGFEQIIDTVGGIDVYVDKDLSDPLYPAANMIDYDPFSIKAGDHHMNGATALKYARSRESTSDFDRSKRQQKVIVATKEKIMSAGTLTNPAKIVDLLNALGDHIRTNMSIDEVKSLWGQIKDFDTQNMINKVFDTSADSPLISSTSQGGAYIIIPKKGAGNFSDLQEITKNIFNTASSGAKIEVLNGSGKSGAAKKVSDALKALGYNVTKTGDATQRASSAVYNCSGGDTASVAEELATKMNTEVQTKNSCSGIDIQVIIGQNYDLNS